MQIFAAWIYQKLLVTITYNLIFIEKKFQYAFNAVKINISSYKKSSNLAWYKALNFKLSKP